MSIRGASPQGSAHPTKILVAFDFDSTLVESNCDNCFVKVIPEKSMRGRDHAMWDIPQSIRRSKPNKGPSADILKCLDEIHFISGMRELVGDLARRGHEVIIISDCNSVFIGHTLKRAGLQECVTRVFTNPSWFDDNGCLRLAEHHRQDWCALCPPNLCKGHVLRNYLGQRRCEGVDFLFVVYVGDGRNDLCPALCLAERDLVLPRLGYDLYRAILGEDRHLYRPRSKIVPWQNGAMAHKAIFDELQQYKTTK